MLGAAARAVNILDPQQKASAVAARGVMRQDHTIGVAKVQSASRRRGEAGDDHEPACAVRVRQGQARAHRREADQRPLKTGSRFSMKAATPSL